MAVRFKGLSARKVAYVKRFWQLVAKQLGAAYPFNVADNSTAEYHFSCGKPVEDSAAWLAENRRIGVGSASRFPCKAWFDEFDGAFRCEPCVPQEVQATVRAALANGCTHGTVFHWARVHHGQFRTGSSADDVRPEVYTWEKLR